MIIELWVICGLISAGILHEQWVEEYGDLRSRWFSLGSSIICGVNGVIYGPFGLGIVLQRGLK